MKKAGGSVDACSVAPLSEDAGGIPRAASPSRVTSDWFVRRRGQGGANPNVPLTTWRGHATPSAGGEETASTVACATRFASDALLANFSQILVQRHKKKSK